MPDGSDCATRFTVVAVDTNLLVYAYRADSPFHADARTLIDSLVEGAARWAIPWPCVHEFIAIVTHPRVFKTPTPVAIALSQIRDLASLPQVTFLAESDDYLSRLEAVALPAKSRGGMIHDARIAALCLHHGIAELLSADRDFSRFPALRTRNPLVAR